LVSKIIKKQIIKLKRLPNKYKFRASNLSFANGFDDPKRALGRVEFRAIIKQLFSA